MPPLSSKIVIAGLRISHRYTYYNFIWKYRLSKVQETKNWFLKQTTVYLYVTECANRIWICDVVWRMFYFAKVLGTSCCYGLIRILWEVRKMVAQLHQSISSFAPATCHVSAEFLLHKTSLRIGKCNIRRRIRIYKITVWYNLIRRMFQKWIGEKGRVRIRTRLQKG